MAARRKPANLPKTLTVPEAGRLYFGLGRAASYNAAHRGEIPVIRIGKKMLVPIVALEQMLADCKARTSGRRTS